MKRLLLAAAMLTPATAFADQLDELCPKLGSIAHKIMTARQAEVPMSTVMATLDAAKDDGLSKSLRNIVILAYEQPAYRTSENQKRAADTFRNDVEVGCWKKD